MASAEQVLAPVGGGRARRAHAALARLAVLCGALAAALPAQVAWAELDPTQAPHGRTGHAMAYDGARGGVLLFGGYTDAGLRFFGDTWHRDGAGWTQRSPSRSPGARLGHAMVHDAARGRVLLFGGTPDWLQSLGDTWEWDGADWSRRFPPTSPPARRGHAMAYDAARDRVVVFGGSDGVTLLADTWEWDGATWALREVTGPSPRSDAEMAYDAVGGRVVLFGGFDGRALGDTWEWDGRVWTQREPPVGPRRRCCFALVADAARGRVVCFGGVWWPVAFGPTYLSDSWEWDGARWLQRAPRSRPTGRAGHAMAYDAARGRVVLFGGGGLASSRETWEYGPTTPATYALFGSACAGTAGAPRLAAAPGQAPWLGTRFEVRLSGLPAAGNPAFVFLGSSNTAFGAFTLPLALGFAGMPGCTLWVSPDVTIPLASSAGTATWSVPLCACETWRGITFYNQGGVLDPAANAAGVVLTNAAAGRLGGL